MEYDHASVSQVVLLDGTFASLTEGSDSSIARIHALLSGEHGPTGGKIDLYYAPGQQWAAWRTLPLLISCETLDRSIRDAYAWLARNWRPGNAIYLFGYSRGAIGVCALAEMIEQVGLLLPDMVSERSLALAWRCYRLAGGRALSPRLRHDHVPIRMVGVMDMVMSKGVRLPYPLNIASPDFGYSRGRLPRNVARGVQALALDETRRAFAPIIWRDFDDTQHVEQMWFRGCHPDIGGQLCGYEDARPLANLPLVWLMSCAQETGLPLPQDWRSRHPCNRDAPGLGSWHQWGKIFLSRAPRQVGLEGSEALHGSVALPYPGPAWLDGHLGWAGTSRRPRRSWLRPRDDGGADHSAPA